MMGKRKPRKKNNNDSNKSLPESRPYSATLNKTKSLFETDILSVDVSPTLGRYLKGKVHIKKGQLIIKEECLVAGPSLKTGPVCVGCHAKISVIAAKSKCGKCQWPTCTPNCSRSPFHKNECSFFFKRKILPSPTDLQNKHYWALSTMRSLLLKLYEPTKWKKLMLLEHHNDIRYDLPVWEENHEVVKVIQDEWKLKDLFTEQEIYTACGIFEVNGFEMGDFSSYGGVFPVSSMLAHSCVPNACQNENMDDNTLEVHAITDIPIGSSITLCYDAALKGTLERQRQLWNSKYFECTCKRCQDPTELGTNLSTMYCFACKKGVLSRNSISLLEEGIWSCNRCHKSFPDKDVNLIIRKYDLPAKSLPTIQVQEEFLSEIKGIFHPNHYIPLAIKFNLCMAYGRDEGYNLFELSLADVHRKLDLCNEVLKVLNVVTPGLSVARGNILYEQQAAEVVISKSLVETGKCSISSIKKRLIQNTLRNLNEAIEIFELHYPLRMLATSSKASTLVELQAWIESLK